MSCKMSVLKIVADMAGWTIAMAIGSRVMLSIIYSSAKNRLAIFC